MATIIGDDSTPSRQTSLVKAIQNHYVSENTEQGTQLMVGNHYSDTSTDISTEMLGYSLNKDKALAKKILAGKRQPLEYELTGGGHRLHFDAGTYEHVRRFFYKYIQKLDHQVKVDLRDRVDSDKMMVDHRITVYSRKTNCKIYTANLFNTTTSALVNGIDPLQFTSHLEDFLSIIDQKKVEEINIALQNLATESDTNGPRRSSRSKKLTHKAKEIVEQPNKPNTSKKPKASTSNLNSNLSTLALENPPQTPKHVADVGTLTPEVTLPNDNDDEHQGINHPPQVALTSAPHNSSPQVEAKEPLGVTSKAKVANKKKAQKSKKEVDIPVAVIDTNTDGVDASVPDPEQDSNKYIECPVCEVKIQPMEKNKAMYKVFRQCS